MCNGCCLRIKPGVFVYVGDGDRKSVSDYLQVSKSLGCMLGCSLRLFDLSFYLEMSLLYMGWISSFF